MGQERRREEERRRTRAGGGGSRHVHTAYSTVSQDLEPKLVNGGGGCEGVGIGGPGGWWMEEGGMVVSFGSLTRPSASWRNVPPERR